MSKKSYAEQGLENIQADTAAAEAAVAENYNNVSTGDDEFVQVGGLEPVAYFFRTSAPKPGKEPKSPYRIIEKGQTVTGTYERSFTAGKFKQPTYLIRLETGELVGLPSAGSLRKAFEKLAEGSKVKVTYDGMATIQGGEWEGQDAHQFIVMGTKLKPKA